MIIAIFFHDDDVFSGATRSMFSLAEYWSSKGNTIIAFIPGHGALKHVAEEKGFIVKEIPSFKTRINLTRGKITQLFLFVIGVFSNAFLHLYSRFMLFPFAKKMHIEILYSNTTATMVGYELKKLLKIPLIWHIREFGKLDQNCEYVFGRKALCRRINSSDLVVYISNAVKKSYSPYLCNTREIVVYNDISKDFDCFFERNWKKELLSFLSVGGIIPGKGHKCAIDAIIKLHNEGYPVELKIAGKGKSYMIELEKYITNQKANSYIHMLGQVSDMKQLRESCEVGIVASLMEAFGRVTIEGMLSGLLMIGANSGGTAELISDGENGYLFIPDDVESLASIIRNIFDDREMARKLAINGYHSALKFTTGNCAQRILDSMQRMIELR